MSSGSEGGDRWRKAVAAAGGGGGGWAVMVAPGGRGSDGGDAFMVADVLLCKAFSMEATMG